MNFDFNEKGKGAEAEGFAAWLESETLESLKRSSGDVEIAKSATFLFVNRAFEAHMPESQIAQVFATCVVRAGFTAAEEEKLFDWLETFAQLARCVHAGKSPQFPGTP